MTVAGRRPPSRWSWRSAFGAWRIVSGVGIAPMVRPREFRARGVGASVERPMTHRSATRPYTARHEARGFGALPGHRRPRRHPRPVDHLIAEARRATAGRCSSPGPAGLGKTRLIRAVVRKAEAAGLRVDGGSVAPQDHQVPLASIREMAIGDARQRRLRDAVGATSWRSTAATTAMRSARAG